MCAYDCAQLQYTIQHRTGPIISPSYLQTTIIAQMFSVGGEGLFSCKMLIYVIWCHWHASYIWRDLSMFWWTCTSGHWTWDMEVCCGWAWKCLLNWFVFVCASVCVFVSPSIPPSPPLDSIRVMVNVWRLRGNIIGTAPCWVVWHNVHSQQHTYVSSSYRSSRLGFITLGPLRHA